VGNLCVPQCGFLTHTSEEGEKGGDSAAAAYGGGIGGQGGLSFHKGNLITFFYDVYKFAMDVVVLVESYGTAYEAYIYAIEDGYGAYLEGRKIWGDDAHDLVSKGSGGGAPDYASDLSSFWVPLGGGGGGGAGKLFADPDKAGGGGGGSGGGAPSLKLITASGVWIRPGGSINGRGGNGGHGGDGSGGWQGQASPGGGGGGGNGAQIFVIAGGMQNYGTINLKGGVGGASGRITDEGNDPFIFIRNGFGEPGKNGVLRVDGNFSGSYPRYASFHKGPYGDMPLHPWQKQVAFNYPLPDSDSDGLIDALETILGTDPNNPDSDGDGYFDAYEVTHGSDPKNPASIPLYTLTISKAGTGEGGVTSSPSGLDCGPTCQATYPALKTSITLTASPTPGSHFAGWSGGGCTGPNTVCTLNNLSADTTVVANFEKDKTLNVTKAGLGSGLVTSSPPGIDCGSTCQATFWHVTLQAIPSEGSYQ
jgi:hypothetical protein